MSTTKRPATCGEMFAVDPTLGAEGCKRLPRHGGEHRGHLTVRAERKAVAAKSAPKVKRSKATKAAPKATLNALVRDIRAKVEAPRGRLNATKRREAIGLLMAAVEEGRVTAGDALGLTARF